MSRTTLGGRPPATAGARSVDVPAGNGPGRSLPGVLARHGAWVFAAVLPAAFSCLVVWGLQGTTVLDYFPLYELDQLRYWRDAATAAAMGLGGGYVGIDETTSTLKGFGPHGILTPLVFGGLARLFGLGSSPAAIPVLNLFLVSALALLSFRWTSASAGEALLAGLSATLFPPLALYLPTAFPEGLHAGLAFLVAAVLYRMAAEDTPRRSTVLLAAGVITFASLVRYTWAMAYIPYFFALFAGRRRRLLSSLACAGACTAAVLFVFNLFVPAWYLAPQSDVNTLSALLSGDFGPFAARLGKNLAMLADIRGNRAASAVLLGMLFLLTAGATLPLLSARFSRKATPGLRRRAVMVALANASILGGLLLVVTLVYAGQGMLLIRLVGASALCCLLLTLRLTPWPVFKAVVVYNAALIPMYLLISQAYNFPAYADNAASRERVAQCARIFAPALGPLAGGDPWRDTVLLALEQEALRTAFMSIPLGYGLQQYILDQSGKKLPERLRCRFVLAAPDQLARFEGRPELNVVGDTPLGRLYVNPGEKRP